VKPEKSKMVKSGINVSETVKNYFKNVHMGALKGFKFTTKGPDCVVDMTSVLPAGYETPFQTLIMTDLKDTEACFFAVNISFRDAEGKLVKKTMLFVWCSDNASVQQRMVMASSVAGVKSALGVQEGCCVELHGQDDQCIDSVFGKIIGNGSKPTVFENRPVSQDPDNKTYYFAD